jgi:hypothetical protein
MPTFWRSATDASWPERLHMHGEAGAGDVPTAAVAQLKSTEEATLEAEQLFPEAMNIQPLNDPHL